jgi:hypothetical protein
MIKMKKSDLIIAVSILAAVLAGLLLVFMSCENVTDEPTTSDDGNTFDPGLESLPDADGNPPIPHARILKLTTTGENDTVVSSGTTNPPASTNWPAIGGRDVKHDPTNADFSVIRTVERWQFVIEWKREGAKTDAQIKAALKAAYEVYQTWLESFDPLPYFADGNPLKPVPAGAKNYNGPNVDYLPGATRVGTSDSDHKVNQSDSLTINWARYWPPASVTGPAGLTKHLSYDSWVDARSLPLRRAAYNAVKKDIEKLNANLEASPLYAVEIEADGQIFAAIDRINMGLKRVVYEGLDAADPPVNFTNFKWVVDAKGAYVVLDEGKSGRLYEAYFGFVPNAGGYSNNKLTYPEH